MLGGTVMDVSAPSTTVVLFKVCVVLFVILCHVLFRPCVMVIYDERISVETQTSL